MRALATRAGWTGALAVAGASGAGVLVAISPAMSERMPAAVALVVLALVAAVILAFSVRGCLRRLRFGKGPERLGSALLAGGALIAVVLPGAQLLAGLRESILSELGFEAIDAGADVATASLIFLLALVAFAAGETLSAAAAREDRRAERGRIQKAVEARETYLVLIAVGLLVAWLLPVGDQQDAFSTRGETEGEGIVALLWWSFPLAVTLGVLKRHWGSPILVALSIGVLAYGTVALGTRSPLLLVGIAVLLRLLASARTPGRTARMVAVTAACLYLGAAAAVGVASWRGAVIEGEQASITDEIGGALVNPFSRLADAGLDTLDGLILATKVDPAAIGASPADLTKVATGFVPHQLWPEKPEWLGNELTEYYLGVGGGGLFISGPGYGLVIFGGVLGMGLAFVVLGAGSAALYRRFEPASAAAAFLTYFFARFFFGGGDAFDAFHVIGLCLVLAAAAALGAIARAVLAGPSTQPQLSPGA